MWDSEGLVRSRSAWLLMFSAAAVCLLAAGCAEEPESKPSGPATLQVATLPAAEVVLDGEGVGDTPVSREVAPGAHRMTLRREGFREANLDVDLKAGEHRTVDRTLVAEDPRDPAAIEALAYEFDLDMAALEKVERYRGGKKPPTVQVLFPRGDVRVRDLDDFRIDVTADFEGEGKLEFRLGKKVVSSESFEPEGFTTVASIPDAVMKALKVGTSVTWGYYGEGRPVTAQFKVVKSDARMEKRIAEVEKKLKDQSPLLVAQMRAQIYLNKRLYWAAYREAREVTQQAEAAPQAYAIMQAALRRMKLHKTVLWTEVQGKVERLPRFLGRARAISR